MWAFWHSYNGMFHEGQAGNGVFERANETGGFLLGYRYNFNRWLAAEASYGYDRNNSISAAHPLASSPTSTKSLVQQQMGDAALAHEMIEAGHVRGKLVLKVAELSC